jgi:hypothetical protein
VVGAPPGQADALPTDAKRIARIEGEVGTGRVGSLSRVSSRLLSAEPTRTTSRPNSDAGADVVGVVVGVDRVGHLVGDSVGGGDLVDRPLQVVPDARGGSNSTTPSPVVRKAAW